MALKVLWQRLNCLLLHSKWRQLFVSSSLWYFSKLGNRFVVVVVVTSQTKQHPNQQVVYWCNLDKKKTNINWLGRTLNVTHPLPPPLAKWWWTEWGPWSSCSKPSGGGERTRERFCDSNGVAFNIDRVMPKECAEESNKKESQKCRKGREGKSFEKWTRTELFLKCPRNWNLISKFDGGVRFDRGEGSILANGPTVVLADLKILWWTG